MKKIGTNINQIARCVNTDNKVTLKQLEELNKNMGEVWHILKSKISNQL